ncbi:MAG: hypothetical protein ABSF69_01155 [Polyangiaceae bacterium]
MQAADAWAMVLVCGAGASFLGAERALVLAQDLRALYGLGVGFVCLWKAANLVRSGVRTR